MPAKSNDTPLLQTEAWLWQGNSRLPGTIQLWPDRLLFYPQDFPHGNLKLEIFLSDIEEMDTLLVFNLSRLGLLIRTRYGSIDQFILSDPESFRKTLSRQIEKINPKP